VVAAGGVVTRAGVLAIAGVVALGGLRQAGPLLCPLPVLVPGPAVVFEDGASGGRSLPDAGPAGLEPAERTRPVSDAASESRRVGRHF
jgi:hypothetical protein